MHIILPHSGGAYVVISWYRFEQRYVTSWSMHLFWIFIFVFIVWHYVGVSDIFHVLSYLVWFVVSHKQTVGIWRWRRADSCDVYGGIPGDSTEVPFLFTVKDTMTSLYGAPCAVRLWIFVVCLLSPLLWGYQAWRIFRYVEGLFDFDGMHYPIIIFNFLHYLPLTLHLDHTSKTYERIPFYWCDDTNKMTWLVGDGSGGMIVNSYREWVVIYWKFLRLAADVRALIWRYRRKVSADDLGTLEATGALFSIRRVCFILLG